MGTRGYYSVLPGSMQSSEGLHVQGAPRRTRRPQVANLSLGMNLVSAQAQAKASRESSDRILSFSQAHARPSREQRVERSVPVSECEILGRRFPVGVKDRNHPTFGHRFL